MVKQIGWSFRARFEDIDLARACKGADEAGLVCIEVGCQRCTNIGTRVLIRNSVCVELFEYEYAADCSRTLVPKRLQQRTSPWVKDEYSEDWSVPGWCILLEHEAPVTAKRAAELLHAMRTLREERLLCVVRAI
jgi:hypothetical protein